MGKDFGEPIRYDPTFNGPIHNRSCTDILWLIAFILFLGAWGWVGYHSIAEGNIEKLLAPIDSNGKRCGMDSEVQDKKYLVFFDISKCLSPDTPITGCPTKQVCVNKCPDSTILFLNPLMDETKFLQVRSNMVCNYDINVENLHLDTARQLIANGECATYVIQSQPVFGRCFVDVKEALEKIEEIAKKEMNETQVVSQVAELVKFQEVDSTYIVLVIIVILGGITSALNYIIILILGILYLPRKPL